MGKDRTPNELVGKNIRWRYDRCMSRDLLYKPPVPLQLPDEEEEDGKKVKDAKANASVPGKGTPAAQGPKGAPRPAFMNQYFNRDVNALSQANQAQSGMRALRGEESAMDLKKIVLPTPDGLEQTEGLAEIASKVVSACERSEGVRGALVGLAQWAQENEGKESFNRRWAELDEMVEARKIAMARLKKLDVEKTAQHPTIAQLLTRENATDTPEDVVGGAQELSEQTLALAEGMLKRLKKARGE